MSQSVLAGALVAEGPGVRSVFVPVLKSSVGDAQVQYADAPLVKFKINWKGDMRRFSCACSFQQLASTASSRFGLANMDGFVFQYVDADHDLITVGSTQELREAVADLSDGATLKMTLAISKHSAPPKAQPVPPIVSAEPAPTIAQAAGTAPVADAVPSEEHLTCLLMAIIETMELDPETTMAWVASLSPEDVKNTLKKSPLSLVGTFLASRDAFAAAASSASRASASEAFTAAASSATAAFASTAEAWATQVPPPPPSTHEHRRGGSKAQPHAGHLLHHLKHHLKSLGGNCHRAKHHDGKEKKESSSCRQSAGSMKKDLPPVPQAGLQMGASGDAVLALQMNLVHVGYLRCGKKFGERRGKYDAKTADAVWRFQEAHVTSKLLTQPGIFCETTRDALVKEVAISMQELGTQAAAPNEEDDSALQQNQVSITDIDGDTMVFKLTVDGSRVQEYVNGALEIDEVKHLEIDPETGQVRDAKGRFTVKSEERETKIQALTALVSRVGVAITSPPVRTVHIDVDLNAPKEEMEKARAAAGRDVRHACQSLGADPEAALKQLAAVFAALPVSLESSQGQKAAAALSGVLEARGPLVPEPFNYNEAAGTEVGCVEAHTDTANVVSVSNLARVEVSEIVCAGAADGAAEHEVASEGGVDVEVDGVPNFQWSKELQSLREMGLADERSGVGEWELVQLLEKHLGSLDRVVESLFQRDIDMV